MGDLTCLFEGVRILKVLADYFKIQFMSVYSKINTTIKKALCCVLTLIIEVHFVHQYAIIKYQFCLLRRYCTQTNFVTVLVTSKIYMFLIGNILRNLTTALEFLKLKWLLIYGSKHGKRCWLFSDRAQNMLILGRGLGVQYP